MKGKKGAEMTIGTLVVIALAVIVLVTVLVGYGYGFANLWDKIKNLGGSVNVDSVKQACELACTTGAKTEYCCVERSVKQNTSGTAILMNCSNIILQQGAACTIAASDCKCT